MAPPKEEIRRSVRSRHHNKPNLSQDFFYADGGAGGMVNLVLEQFYGRFGLFLLLRQFNNFLLFYFVLFFLVCLLSFSGVLILSFVLLLSSLSSSHIILSFELTCVGFVVVVVGGGMAELISALGKIFSFCFSTASSIAASGDFVGV